MNKISIPTEYKLDNHIPKHIIKLFEYILAEVLSAGGDGDCLIICKVYYAQQLAELFLNYLKANKYNYFLDIFDEEDSHPKEKYFIVSNRSNENWVFTDNESFEYPEWQQCIIRI